MKFICTIANQDGGEPWKEDFDKPHVKDLAGARECASNMVDFFNSSLRPGEKPRRLLDVVLADAAQSDAHSWEKVNLFTLKKDGRFFDEMRCRVCRITGKRYGVHENIIRDRDYRANGFASCTKSVELLERRKRKGGAA